jgi:hypothetical protein
MFYLKREGEEVEEDDEYVSTEEFIAALGKGVKIGR